jgi:hypothetical protein
MGITAWWKVITALVHAVLLLVHPEQAIMKVSVLCNRRSITKAALPGVQLLYMVWCLLGCRTSSFKKRNTLR